MTRRFSLVLLLLVLLPLLPGPRPAQARQPALDASGSDVVIIIDHSESMADNDPNFWRLAAAKLFIDLAQPGDRIGIVVMSGASSGRRSSQSGTRALTRRMVEIGDGYETVADTRELKGMVEGLRQEAMGDYTHMGPALNEAYSLLDELPVRAHTPNDTQFVVMLTDGKPTSAPGLGEAETLVAEAASRFQSRQHWNVFAIALGAAAMPDYLEQAVAQPTGGAVVAVEQASGLLDAYLDIYAMVDDERFIERITVPSNMLAPLMHIRPDHQATQISVVILPGESGARIRRLQAPDGRDIVDPSVQHSIRRGEEPEYELYTVPPDAPVSLIGPWMIDIERADGAPQQVVVLSQTRLRIQMLVPPPPEDDNRNLRYHPVGRPLHLVVGAEVAERNPEGTPDQPFRYRQVTDMAVPPTVQVVGPQQPAYLPYPTRDDGQEYDRERGDGHYTMLHPLLREDTTHRIRVEMAPQPGEPIHVYRDFLLRVTVLPTLTLSLAEPPGNLRVTTPLTGSIRLSTHPDFQVRDVRFPAGLAFVRRPDGAHDPLQIEQAADGAYQFTYVPDFVGEHRISIIANVTGDGHEGVMRYADYVEHVVDVQPVLPTIDILPAFSEPIVSDRDGGVQVSLHIGTSGIQGAELLYVSVDEWAGSVRVVPDTLRIEPSQLVQTRSVLVYLPEEQRGEDGRLTLNFATGSSEVVLSQRRVSVAYEAPFPLALFGLVLLLLLGGGGWFLYRRARR
jgi:hypothetical protein